MIRDLKNTISRMKKYNTAVHLLRQKLESLSAQNMANTRVGESKTSVPTKNEPLKKSSIWNAFYATVKKFDRYLSEPLINRNEGQLL